MGNRIRRIVNAGNAVRLIISILFAFILWGFVQWETDPERSRTAFGVPIEVEDLDARLQFESSLPLVTIQMEGPESVIQDIDTSEVRASIDMSDVTEPGTTIHRVRASTPDGLRKVTVDPETVEVTVDLNVSVLREVTMRLPAESPPNLTAIELSTDEVVLSGTQTNMNQVESVEVAIDLTGRTESFTDEVEPVPVDAGGVRVEGIDVSPDSIRVEVIFEVRSKNVDVVVVCACVTSDGRLDIRELEEASAIPSTVRLSGPESLITDIESISTVPIDITFLEESGWIQSVELDTSVLPLGVSVANRTVDVWVTVEEARVEFTDVPIQVNNVEPGLRPILSPEAVSLVVTGLPNALTDLESAPTVVVDAASLGSGSYFVPLSVIVPPELSFSELVPDEVRLTLINIELTPATGQPAPPAPVGSLVSFLTAA